MKQDMQVITDLEHSLRSGNFEWVDLWFDNIDIKKLSEACIIAALTITFYGKNKLVRRDAFLQCAEVILKERLGEDRVEKLLKNRR
jgi:hypothetical protein